MKTLEEIALAERSVVGECIFAPASVRLAAALVAPQDFYDPRLGELFGLIAGMVSAGGPESVTHLTVRSEVMRRHGEAKSSQGKATLPDLGDLAALMAHGIAGDPREHARIVREAAVLRSIAALGRRAVQAAENWSDPGVLAAKVADEAMQIRDGHRPAALGARSLGEVLADEDADEYHWVVPGLLEARDRLVITGGEGLGKSTYLRQIAICAAAGVHPFTCVEIEPCHVLYVDCENSEKQWRRKARGLAAQARQLGVADPLDNLTLSCVRRLDITTAADLGAIHALVDEHQPGLVVVGPLYRLVPRAITNDDDAAPVLAALDSIRDRGPALIMEAHAGHAVGKGGERDYRPRGSSALLGWPEFGFGMAPDEKDPGRAEVIRWRGDRDERSWPKAVRRGGVLPWTNDMVEPGRELSQRERSEWSADAIQSRQGAAS